MVASAAQCVDERRVELPEPVDQRLARIAAEALGVRARRIELAHGIIEDWIKRSIAARAQRGQAGDDPLEMSWKTGLRTCKVRAALTTCTIRLTRPTRRRYAD